MALAIVETAITSKDVRMRLADNKDPASSSEQIDLKIEIGAHLGTPSHTGDIQLGDVQGRQLGAIQLAVLRRAQDAISAEIQRLVMQLHL